MKLDFINSFTAKVLTIFTIIFILTSAVPVGDDPQVINLCDTTYALKKYSVYPPAGYISTWFVDPEVQLFGNPNDNTITIKWTEPGSYTILAQFSNGRCVSVNSLEVIVEGCPESTLYIPNAFTPDGDNTNDVFGAYGTQIIEFSMEIYNRWGELIFVSNELEYRWDGYYKGELCQQDVYVYKINYRGYNLAKKNVIGRVSLVH
jgi:gliding motility-associated-like protein